MIEYRILHEMTEFEALVDLEIAIWGLNPRNTVPSALLHVMALNGGLVMGAYAGDQMVGLLVSMAVKREMDVFLWSHMTGTHPNYQGRGIGLALKRHQHRWAVEQGYNSIRWTVDPLQRGNAWFNLRLLGQEAALSCHQYHVNFYGDMDDDINRGLPSDRLEFCWWVDQPSLHRLQTSPGPALICQEATGQPRYQPAAWDTPTYSVPVPSDLNLLRQTDPDAVLPWRIAVREALSAAFEQNYIATDFIRQDEQYMYLLTRQE